MPTQSQLSHSMRAGYATCLGCIRIAKLWAKFLALVRTGIRNPFNTECMSSACCISHSFEMPEGGVELQDHQILRPIARAPHLVHFRKHSRSHARSYARAHTCNNFVGAARLNEYYTTFTACRSARLDPIRSTQAMDTKHTSALRRLFVGPRNSGLLNGDYFGGGGSGCFLFLEVELFVRNQ